MIVKYLVKTSEQALCVPEFALNSTLYNTANSEAIEIINCIKYIFDEKTVDLKDETVRKICSECTFCK